MIKKVTTLFLVIALTVFAANFVFADEKKPPPLSSKKGNFKKGNFSKKNAWNNKGKATSITGAPDPNDATGATDMPISNGLTFLVLGSALYLIKRVRDEKNEKIIQNNIENT